LGGFYYQLLPGALPAVQYSWYIQYTPPKGQKQLLDKLICHTYNTMDCSE